MGTIKLTTEQLVMAIALIDSIEKGNYEFWYNWDSIISPLVFRYVGGKG